MVAAPIHEADQGDTTTLTPTPTLDAAARNLAELGLEPTVETPCDLIADKRYHSREQLKDLDAGV